MEDLLINVKMNGQIGKYNYHRYITFKMLKNIHDRVDFDGTLPFYKYDYDESYSTTSVDLIVYPTYTIDRLKNSKFRNSH